MYDLTGCGIANLDVTAFKDVLILMNTHYVERLSAMYFYNPPAIFWGLWNTFKGLLRPVTREKIKFIDPADLAELRALVPANVSNLLTAKDCTLVAVGYCWQYTHVGFKA